MASSTLLPQVDLDALLDGHQTLYLVGDEDDQRILRPLFVGLVDAVMRHAASRTNRSIRAARPLPVLLNEAANSAPLPDLDRYASVARDRGVLNNHQAKVVLAGVTDRGLLEYLSGLLSDERIRQRSTSGRASHLSESETRRLLATVDELRRLPPDRALLVHASTRPARIGLRLYYRQRALAAPRCPVTAKRRRPGEVSRRGRGQRVSRAADLASSHAARG